MHPLHPLIGLELWVGSNISHNLNYVPEDKFAWKPAPDAKSVQEIIAEVVGATQMMAGVVGGTLAPIDPASVVDIASAKSAVEAVTRAYADFLAGLTPEDLGGDVDMMGKMMPKAQVLGFAVVEAIHHHGQIAFIQTLWGDTTSHFVDFGT